MPPDLPLLPLPLLRSHTVPSAPLRRKSAVDFLPDFAGESWIAFAASSLLVISHFPSPLSEPAALLGPAFRQAVHPILPADVTGDVIAVSWCPARPSDGEIAVAVGNCVCLFAPDEVTAAGSFCWRQTACILQYFSVEAIRWTGCGDGLVAAGTDVVLWERKSTSWEIAWKSKAEFPQALISATWYAEGLVATAANLSVHTIDTNAKYSSLYRDDCARVSVYHTDGESGIMKVQLCHPQPVTMIQWRPSTLTRSSKGALHSWRDVLLTCCLDGTVRMWSEIDNSRGRKHNKNIKGHKSAGRSFHVIAVIEINQCTKGTLSTDIFVEWATELGPVISKLEGDSYCLSPAGLEHGQIGKCEWLISFGPQCSLTFWAIHCLDDLNPLRFPRVTLWKKLNLMDFNSYSQCNSSFTDFPITVKSLITRSEPFGPPVECSLVQLLPGNSVGWFQLYTSSQSSAEDGASGQINKDKNLSSFALRVLNQDGHTGNILQLVVHPYYEIEIAVSLDSHGFLLFWLLPTISNCTLGMQMIGPPAWKLLGKVNLQDLSNNTQYSCLQWAPSVLDENLFLLLGYVNGIDCFLVSFSGEEKSISCDKILTVPFGDHGHGQEPPDELSATPLPTTCEDSFLSNSFLLIGIWKKKFQALSWKFVLHSSDPSGRNCGCRCDSGILSISEKERYTSSVGKMFDVTIYLGSSVFPNSQSSSHVTSVCLTTPDKPVLSIQPATYDVKYHMATGCSDGTLKLWKMSHAESNNSETGLLPWELVGMFSAHQGPVSKVSLSSCGGNVATVSTNTKDSTTRIHIWKPICLIRGGSFLLESAISLNEPVVALNWLSIGNGHSLLAVCMPNELRIYSEKILDRVLSKLAGPEEMVWCCIGLSHTFPVSYDFLWGPKVTPVIIHKNNFSLFSPWLLIAENGSLQEGSGSYAGAIDQNLPFPIFSESDSYNTKELSKDFTGENGLYISTICSKMFHIQDSSGTKIRCHSLLDIADRLCEPLEVYHPMALLQHLYSGNWKRAYVVLKHLISAVKSNEVSAASFKSAETQKNCFPDIDLSRYFEEVVSIDSVNKGLQWGQENISGSSSLLFQNHSFLSTDNISNASSPGNISSVTSQKSEIMGFIDTMEQSFDKIYALRNIEKTLILAIIDLLGQLSESSYSSAYNSLDKPARRFWVGVRFERMYSLRKFGSLAAEELVIDSRLLAWAFQSDCQENLLSSLLSANPSWIEMRNLGVGLWFTDATQLRTRMEKLARLQYLSRKDPKDCALLYLALNRLQVLAGLFKISKDEKDKLLVGFLSRNFQEEKNKAAALKNAYVLMGRHQLELAVAFFLLGGDSSSAVTVCAKNLGDEQLALVICRLIEGNGGKLERHLISNILLPNAIEKGDCWVACLLEWSLGNYSCSINRLLYSRMGSVTHNSSMFNLSAFSDPDIGQYCLTLAAKNNLKNSIGEFSAMVLSKLATLMSVSAFNRYGLPIEALECYSSSYSIDGNSLGSLLDVDNQKIFSELLNPFSSGSSNWLLMGVANDIESDVKLNLAMQYISKLLMDNSSWSVNQLVSSENFFFDKGGDYQDELEVQQCVHKLDMAVSTLKQRYSLMPANIGNMILVLMCNKGNFFHGVRLLQGNSSKEHEADHYKATSLVSNTVLPRLLLKSSREISCLFTQYVLCRNLTNSTLKLLYGRSLISEKESYGLFCTGFCLRSLIFSMKTIRPLLKLYDFHEAFNLRIFHVLDLFEFSVHFASSWFSGNLKVLLLMVEKILNEPVNILSSFEVIGDELMKILSQSSELRDVSADGMEVILDANATQRQLKRIATSLLHIPEDEIWQMIGVCVWKHLSDFGNHKFIVPGKIEYKSNTVELINELPLLITKLFITSLAYISSSLTRQLAFFLRQKVSKGFPLNSLMWLDEPSHHKSHTSNKFLHQGVGPFELTSNEEMASEFRKLWEISVRPEKICENFVNEGVACFPNRWKIYSSWNDMLKDTSTEYEADVTSNNKADGNTGSSTSGSVVESLSTNRVIVTDGLVETVRRGSIFQRDITYFHNPTEVLKRNGELMEAICFNSVDEQQVAVASNRKGLLFTKWKTEQPVRGQAEYIWSESDWPLDGWAGCESTPVPTYVSQGIGLGSKRGSHLGLGGATVGLGSLARPGKDLTGGGAFGIPGYAGIGASGLGWGEQEEFEEFADPPATVSNISSGALSRHPCRPFFLVGSSNTHIYLWEFDKERATATYGVLPAANVPPPYALASISALQFDYCGQRFASAALDGTISTWQLEVGGRSNVYPTESSICFNNHACDVAYVGASGSILAAAGCSANGFNVVVWDTLAPPVTSQVSIVCHEGGARSLSVFDNDVGSGSISPLIVTGGKNGDVGLHDFRFIATGKTKRKKDSSLQDFKSPSVHDNGMLWYIPKAHLGSVTKVSTIPNTTLFLTGGKDGDVKLWDAKKSQLVCHWPKMHDRHTFIQPNSRSLGGVVREAVTDIQVFSRGFLTCGGDGSVKLVHMK